MDFSWYAIVSILIVFTPALLMLVPFRFKIPKARTAPTNDLIVLLSMSLFSFLSNLNLIGSYITNIWGVFLRRRCEDCVSYDLFSVILNGHDFSPVRIAKYFPFVFGASINPDTDLAYFLWDLHLRAFIVGCLIVTIILYFEEADTYFRSLPFDETSNRFSKWLGSLLGYETESHNNKKWYIHPKNRRFAKFYSSLKTLMYNHWNLVFSYNKSTDILLVDIKTSDDNIYSGQLTDWIPKNNEMESISLINTFRFYPDILPNADKPFRTPPAISKNKSLRKMRLVPNDGKMYIPSADIKTLHVWYIKKGIVLKHWVDDKNSEQLMKWYLKLAHSNPTIFKKITLNIYKTDDEFLDFDRSLSNWMDDNNIDISVEVLEVIQVKNRKIT